MVNISRWLITAVILVTAVVSVASGNIVSFTGPVSIIASPPSVLEGDLESDTEVFIFSERLALTLREEFAVNIITNSTYSGNLSPNGFIRDGVSIHSYMVHADHVGTTGSRAYEGSITFRHNILAIITAAATLDSSDPIVGLPSVTYPTNINSVDRGTLDSFNFGDTLSISGNRRTVNFHVTNNSDNVEQFRVITYSPEPTSGIIFLLGGLPLVRRD